MPLQISSVAKVIILFIIQGKQLIELTWSYLKKKFTLKHNNWMGTLSTPYLSVEEFIPLSFVNCFLSATLERSSSINDGNSIRFSSRLWLRHFKPHLFFEPFRDWLVVCFGSLCWNAVELKVTIWLLEILLQDALGNESINYCKSFRSWRSKAAPVHHTTTTTFVSIMLFFWNAALALHYM